MVPLFEIAISFKSGFPTTADHRTATLLVDVVSAQTLTKATHWKHSDSKIMAMLVQGLVIEGLSVE